MESTKTGAPAPIDLISLLRRFQKSLKRTWLLVLVLTVLLSGANFFRARSSYTPIYECKVIFSVGSGYGSGDVFTSSYFYDTVTAQAMADSFPYLLRTEFMRDLILERLDKKYINGTISTSSLPSTNMMELRVTSANAQDAYQILNAVVDSYPQAAVYMVDNPQIFMREEPTVPTEPINPFSGVSAMEKGALAGIVLGLGITVLLAALNQSIGRVEDLKKIVNLPQVAAMPQVTLKKRRNSVKTFVCSEDDPSFAEALRGLRAKVRRQLDEKNGKIVMLTSTIPGEGKTTVSTNLALSLALEGHRVVLVDADLRNQTVGRLFRASSKNPGMLDCLKNPNLNVLDCLRKAPDSELYFLSGASTQKRHYSLEAKSIRRMLDTLSTYFDYIVVDTPPCGVVSDTSLLARYADCMLYVVKLDYASRSQILDGVTGLYQRDVPLTGCVVNGAKISRSHYGYGYGSKYGYGQKKGRASQ